tara:strand:+ start:2155 stop:3072 length:918 start_codon:yes stop_codon:yes gene_type:complete
MLKKLCSYNKLRVGIMHDEHQYLNLIGDILTYGKEQDGRNGVTKAIFGSAMHFSLADGVVPFMTTKRLAWKTCLKELLWFIKGDTDNNNLKNQNVHIWDANGSRDFLDSRGLTTREEDDLGPIYGFQWRHFNAEYDTSHTDYSNKGIDQLKIIIDALKDPKVRHSRRLLLTAWNPCQLDEMALPPCHVLAQFSVIEDGKLCCSLYQRSGDVGLGVPFNIASYSLLTHILAKHCGLEAHEFYYYIGNTHIYDDHYQPLMEQIKRKPYIFPKLTILKSYESIDNYTPEDFKINDYQYHPSIKMNMRK